MQPTWKGFLKALKFFVITLIILPVYLWLIMEGNFLIYDLIIKSNPYFEKMILAGFFYVLAWTAFNAFYVMESQWNSNAISLKEYVFRMARHFLRIGVMPVIMCITTSLFGWWMHNAKEHNSEDITLAIGVFIWFYIFFKLSRTIIDKNEHDK